MMSILMLVMMKKIGPLDLDKINLIKNIVLEHFGALISHNSHRKMSKNFNDTENKKKSNQHKWCRY